MGAILRAYEAAKALGEQNRMPFALAGSHWLLGPNGEFIVNKDGSVTDVKIVTSLNPICDSEVLRVLRKMPRWTAGLQDGKPCRTKVCIPVVFRL